MIVVLALLVNVAGAAWNIYAIGNQLLGDLLWLNIVALIACTVAAVLCALTIQKEME